MKKIVFMWVVFLMTTFVFVGTAPAALSSANQNIRDLDVMVRFIWDHKFIAYRLRSISLDERTIYYGENYKVVFARGKRTLPPGAVGPAPALEFKSTNDPKLSLVIIEERERSR